MVSKKAQGWKWDNVLWCTRFIFPTARHSHAPQLYLSLVVASSSWQQSRFESLNDNGLSRKRFKPVDVEANFSYKVLSGHKSVGQGSQSITAPG